VIDRQSRFVVACATGPLSQDEGLLKKAITIAVERTHHRPLDWLSDGWHGYRAILRRAYRVPLPREGRRGRRRWVVAPTVSLTQSIKYRDARGRLLSVEVRTTVGTSCLPPGTVHLERFNGVLRDRLNALTRKTHAFAKRDET